MKINKDVIQKLNPCKDRIDNFITHYGTKDYTLKGFLSLDEITYTDKIWVVTKLFTQEQNVKWSIKCAESTLDNFEKLYPEDKRPRLALKAAYDFCIDPSDETRSAAWSAASSAASAARFAAAYAAESAAWSAASAAESAAWSAARSAASTARFAASAAESAASSASSAAELKQEELNLILMLDVYEEGAEC